MGGIYQCTCTSTRGNTLWVLQDKQGTRVQRREGEGLGEERSLAT